MLGMRPRRDHGREIADLHSKAPRHGRAVRKLAGNVPLPRAPLGHHRSRRARDRLQRRLVQGRALEPVGIFLGDEGRGHVTGDEFRMIHHGGHKGQVVADPLDLEPIKRLRMPAMAAARSAPQVQSLAIIGS